MQVFVFVFSGLTGYFGQGNVLDQAYGDALVMELQHYLGRRFNRVISLSNERIRGVFDFILLPSFFYILLFEHWGQCSS